MRYASALSLLLLAPPALAMVPPHSGVIHTRSMPELSDIALFGMAVGGVWLARRALRKRFAKQADTPADTPKD
ncbi:hypothetical protein [Sphingomonas asaccharolytica]|uniref:hypothetical protein n=1 Tax=Sphingomonas asaccharolytica TaxID=40681 RepID=UPI00082F805D|nr:hypothetical protein [Sphingomonas asaccharolytica]